MNETTAFNSLKTISNTAKSTPKSISYYNENFTEMLSKHIKKYVLIYLLNSCFHSELNVNNPVLTGWTIMLNILALANISFEFTLYQQEETLELQTSCFVLCSILSFRSFRFFFSYSFLWVKFYQLEVVFMRQFSKKWKINRIKRNNNCISIKKIFQMNHYIKCIPKNSL